MGDKMFLELSDIEFDKFINNRRLELFSEFETIEPENISGIITIKHKLIAINDFANYRTQMKNDIKIRSGE